MSWQDFVLSVGQILFVVALVPTVVGKDKPALPTSVLTSAVAFSFMVVFASLAVPFASATAGLNGSMWLILAVQKVRQRLRGERPSG